MISLIEAKNYKCLRHVRQPLEPFQVLVGPNASGKTTFLDVVSFVSDMLCEGLEVALSNRTKNFDDLVWQRRGDSFELAIELQIPPDRTKPLRGRDAFGTARYELRIEASEGTGEIVIGAERLLLMTHGKAKTSAHREFPESPDCPQSIFLKSPRGVRTVVSKKLEDRDYYFPEIMPRKGKRGTASYKLGPRKSALAGLPADESIFPVATWVKETLTNGVRRMVLNSLVLRMASPPAMRHAFQSDGASLPWAVENLARTNPARFRRWIAHLQTTLRDLVAIHTVERPDDKHRYVVLEYSGGLKIPSWTVSDGTLRLLALTLPAYLPNMSGTFMIEEPENGIHPGAIQCAFESLSSVYDAQVLCATHSPIILGLVRPASILCFAKAQNGATDIVSGNRHPSLAHWKGEVSLDEMFVAGVLG